ncbi:hypothetical protein CR513_06060, partial [Mucuna pruriens]
MLPYALHGYHTSVRTSTGAIPYSLVCGTEAYFQQEGKTESIQGRRYSAQENIAQHQRPKRKVGTNYEGLFIVKHTFSCGALILTDVEGCDLNYPVNANYIKTSTEAMAEASAPSRNQGKAREIRH